jgi:cell division FtsZ-interacting protein ZapD
MLLKEFATQTKTPDQLRIDSLKATKDKAAKSLAAERQRQQVVKAQKALTVVRQSKPIKPNVP